MRFARWVFRGAAVWGVVVLAPLLFAEGVINRVGPAIGHPEYFYGFLAAALTFQLMFWIIGGDPARFRPLMPVAVAEKLGWTVAAWAIFLQGRTQAPVAAFASIDLLLGLLFAVAFVRTR